DEVKLLRDLVTELSGQSPFPDSPPFFFATTFGRQRVLRALMDQPEYIDHWSEVLVDDLRVAREGTRSQNSCYGAPLRAGPDSAALAQWITNQNPASVTTPDFNMSDVLRSALKWDNLYPAYAAHLFAMENKPGFAGEQERRQTLGGSFGQVYLHREMLCLQCHNSEFSLSGDPPSGWNRTLPIPGNFERALYGAPTGEPTADAFAMFRTDVLGGGTAPWGLTNCGTFKGSVGNDPEGVIAHFIEVQGQQFTIRGVQQKLKQGYDALDADGLNRLLPPEIQGECDFCTNNCTGTSLDVASVANNAPNAAAVKTLFTNTNWNGGKCIDCHSGSGTLYFTTGTDWANELIGVTASGNNSFKRVLPGDANNSYLVKKLEGSAGNQMPQGGPALSAAQINQVKARINGMPVLTACAGCEALTCSQPKRYGAGTATFGFLTATNVVNNIWSEMFGGKLTIANYFPRNPSQRDGLWNLAEYRFVPDHWSPKSVLERALTSTLFNRKAPKFS